MLEKNTRKVESKIRKHSLNQDSTKKIFKKEKSKIRKHSLNRVSTVTKSTQKINKKIYLNKKILFFSQKKIAVITFASD